jgi:dTDP-4-dehydrorhamnose reductase
MRIAVTGANGGLGRAFLEAAPSHHDVHPFSHAELPVEDHHAVMRTLLPLGPEAILHFAAMTGVDACERDEDAAFRANAVGPRNVALAAPAAGANVLAVSTDYVFDGTKGAPYHEFDRPNPVSVYGRSKLAGEEAIRALVPESYVVRTSWVYGAGDDFVSGGLARLAAGETVGAIVDLVGTPTYVRHLADRILPVLLSGRFGTVHLGGPEAMTYHDLLSRAREVGGLPGKVERQKSGDLGRPAERPANSALTSLVAGDMPIPPMPPVDQAVTELLERIRGGG